MIEALYSPLTNDQLQATERFRKLLSREPNPPIEEVIEAKILHRFVEFLTDTNNPTLQVNFVFLAMF